MKDFFVANATSETVLVKAFDDDVEVRKLMKTGGSTRGELKLGVDQAGVKAYFNVALEIFSKKTVVEMGKPPKLGYAPLAPLHALRFERHRHYVCVTNRDGTRDLCGLVDAPRGRALIVTPNGVLKSRTLRARPTLADVFTDELSGIDYLNCSRVVADQHADEVDSNFDFMTTIGAADIDSSDAFVDYEFYDN